MNKNDGNNKFLNTLFAKFDKTLAYTISSTTKRVNLSIEKVEKRLRDCEIRLQECVELITSKAQSELKIAEGLVNKELKSKMCMDKWTKLFMTPTKDDVLDPITFAISRFALNISLCYRDVQPIYFIKTNIYKHLVDYISVESELTIGPACMGLVHISLHDALKPEIISAGALSPLLKLMVTCKSKPILAQCCKLCGSLALYRPNKALLANNGCMHALFDLILGAHVDVDVHIQYATLCALLNVIFESDSNRMLSIELNGISPIVTLLQTTSQEHLITMGIQILSNISYNNGYTANCVLLAGGGEVLLEVLESGDIQGHPYMALAALTAYSNICNSDVNQTHVGSIKNLVEVAVRICEHAKEMFLITEAANFLLSCVWNCTINKARIASKNACAVLVKQIVAHAPRIKGADDEYMRTTEKLCLTLSSILIYPNSHERMVVIGGLESIVKLCKQLNEPRLLRALATVVVAMVPPPEELLRLHKDDSKALVEKIQAVVVLKKAKFGAYEDIQSVPEWLERAIQYLSLTDSALEKLPESEKRWMKAEFIGKEEYRKDLQVPIEPDASVLGDKEFQELVFSIN